MKVIVSSVIFVSLNCLAMQHEDLHKAIQDNDHHKVHAILQARKIASLRIPDAPASTPTRTPTPNRTPSYGTLSTIDLGNVENPNNLLALAQEAEELAEANAGTYGNLATIFRALAGLGLIGYGGFQLAVNMGYIHPHDDPNNPAPNVANGTVTSSNCLAFAGLGVHQLYLAFTKRDAVTAQKNAAIITHLVENSSTNNAPQTNSGQ